jgi:hypothetical protein
MIVRSFPFRSVSDRQQRERKWLVSTSEASMLRGFYASRAQATKYLRFLGRDHDDVGIWREQLHDAVGIPRREPDAEAVEDLEQRGLRLRIRPHDQGILAPGQRSNLARNGVGLRRAHL